MKERILIVLTTLLIIFGGSAYAENRNTGLKYILEVADEQRYQPQLNRVSKEEFEYILNRRISLLMELSNISNTEDRKEIVEAIEIEGIYNEYSEDVLEMVSTEDKLERRESVNAIANNLVEGYTEAYNKKRTIRETLLDNKLVVSLVVLAIAIIIWLYRRQK